MLFNSLTYSSVVSVNLSPGSQGSRGERGVGGCRCSRLLVTPCPPCPDLQAIDATSVRLTGSRARGVNVPHGRCNQVAKEGAGSTSVVNHLRVSPEAVRSLTQRPASSTWSPGSGATRGRRRSPGGGGRRRGCKQLR